MPLFGRTQYRLGAVVFTLNSNRRFVGFESVSSLVTTFVNGPIQHMKNSVNTKMLDKSNGMTTTKIMEQKYNQMVTNKTA